MLPIINDGDELDRCGGTPSDNQVATETVVLNDVAAEASTSGQDVGTDDDLG